jgi:hypothetical protein
MVDEVWIRVGSLAIGRFVARASAHACDPQHGRISRAAATGSSAFHRARTLFIVIRSGKKQTAGPSTTQFAKCANCFAQDDTS